MRINNKEFKDWVVEDFHEIIENEVYRENEYIDYKETFAVLECSDKESKRKKQNEFRHDICSFANAEGGYLIFGIKEDAGIPSEIVGIEISNIDKFELDRRNELSGIFPAVPAVEFSFVKISVTKYIVVINISKGIHKPYLYKENEVDYKFYVRRGNRKQTMSYMEIRENFLHSSLFSTEIKKFRKERLQFFAEEYPDTPFAVIQVIPEDFLNDATMIILYNEYKARNIRFHDLFNGLCYGHVFPNVDGVWFPNYERDYGSSLQLFNNGISEFFYKVDVRERNGDKWIETQGILEKMRCLVEGTRDLFTLLERHATVYVCVTISGCKGLWNESDFKPYYCSQVDRNEIHCMPVEIHDVTEGDIVSKAIEKCEMVINYSVGRRNNKDR